MYDETPKSFEAGDIGLAGGLTGTGAVCESNLAMRWVSWRQGPAAQGGRKARLVLASLALLALAGCDQRLSDTCVVDRRAPRQSAPPPPPHRKHARKPHPNPAVASARTKVAQVLYGPSEDSQFGHTVAGAGDVNGDGYADVVVGAFNAGQDAAGAAMLYLGGPAGLASAPSWVYTCPVAKSEFGHQVEGVGDVNGDGYDDFIVGSTYYSELGGRPQTGGAFVFYGGPHGPGPEPNWKMVGAHSGSKAGFTVAAAGDVNGDGYADVLVGAWAENVTENGIQTEGRAYLYLGGPNGLSPAPAWLAHGEQPGSHFGYSVHGIGDVNGDGYDDIVIGSYGFKTAQPNAGRVYVFLGGPNGPSTEPDWTATGTQGEQGLGCSVFSAGDVNGDGYADLVVGATGTTLTARWEGAAYVFLGGPHGLGMGPAWTYRGFHDSFFLGHSVASAGDLNGDGFGDLVVSAPNATLAAPEGGLVLVFLGSKRGLSREPDWTAARSDSRGGFGATVRCGGDVDGDGFQDLIIGWPRFTEGITRRGEVTVVYGSRQGPALSSHWQAGLASLGFKYRTVNIPYPNAAWWGAIGALAITAGFLALWRYYQLRERAAAAVALARDQAQQQERQRLAQDLHDQLGAELTGLVMAGALARQQTGDPARLEARVAHIESTAGRLVENLAEIVWLTKPANDTLRVLTDYLGDMTARSLERVGWTCQLDIPPDLPEFPIHIDLRHDLVLAVKEAVHNAIRHSGGSQLTLETRLLPGPGLKLVVRDNGHGFPATPIGRGGNGMDNLRDRLARHGGSAAWDSNPAGVTVTFTLPRLPEPGPSHSTP